MLYLVFSWIWIHKQDFHCFFFKKTDLWFAGSVRRGEKSRLLWGKFLFQNQSKSKNTKFSDSSHAFVTTKRIAHLWANVSFLKTANFWQNIKWTSRKGHSGSFSRLINDYNHYFRISEKLEPQKNSMRIFWNMPSFPSRLEAKNCININRETFWKWSEVYKSCFLQKK